MEELVMPRFRVFYGQSYPDFYWDTDATSEEHAEELFLETEESNYYGHFHVERIDIEGTAENIVMAPPVVIDINNGCLNCGKHISFKNRYCKACQRLFNAGHPVDNFGRIVDVCSNCGSIPQDCFCE
jgi:hypothetical protein